MNKRTAQSDLLSPLLRRCIITLTWQYLVMEYRHIAPVGKFEMIWFKPLSPLFEDDLAIMTPAIGQPEKIS